MTFGILLFPGVEELDFVGPWEMAAMWSAYADGPEKLVAVAQTKGTLRCAKGLGVVADYDFEDCPDLEYLLIPGGYSVFGELANESLTKFVQRAAKSAKHVLSVCSGAFILHKAGLLDGKNATTHWKAHEQFAALPGVNLVSERWVRDGNTWTSAGVSAGIDMTLAFISEIAGEDAASIVQMNSEYYPDGKIYGKAHEDLLNVDYIKKLDGEM